MSTTNNNRRKFLATTGAAVAGSLIAPRPVFAARPTAKMRVAMVGTGTRGITMWGKSVLEEYGDTVEFVGLCDTNPGRLAFGKQFIGTDCPT